MRILLHIQHVSFRDSPAEWWKDPEWFGPLLASLRGLDLDLHFVGPAGGKLRRFRSPEELLQKASSWTRGIYRLAPENSPEPAQYVDLGILPQGVDLRVIMEAANSNSPAVPHVDRLLGVATELYDHFGDRAVLGPIVEVDLPQKPYPRPRPPRSHRHLRPGTLATVVDRRFSGPSARVDEPALARLISASPPEGVERREHGELLILCWVRELSDAQAIQRLRTRQEEWLAAVLDPPIESGYNEKGDHRISPVSAAEHPLLTLYDGFTREGYKAVVLQPGGGIAPDIAEELRAWTEERQLPDGTPLQRLNLILPNRDAAVRARTEATKLGVRGVYYIDNQGWLWNPFPAGMWIDSDTGG